MNILEMELTDLRNHSPMGNNLTLGYEDFRHIFETCGAFWFYSGDPLAPHVGLTAEQDAGLITTGLCSNGFVNVSRVLKFPNLCEIMASQLVKQLRRHHPGRVDWVIGSDHGSATLSYAVAALIGAQHDFTEKGRGKTQIWRRHIIESGEVVLQVEEVITTGGTLQAVREGIRVGNPNPVTFASLSLALVHRSDVYEFEDKPIFFATHYDIRTWKMEECPLCKGGSKRISRPKENWAELTGKA